MKKIYLAIPYRGMEEMSYQQATAAACAVLASGRNVFSPITHSHPMSEMAGLPGDWEFWKQVDYQFIDWADEVWVVIPREGLERVQKSEGVMAEVTYAKDKDMPVRYFHLEDEKLVEQDMYFNT